MKFSELTFIKKIRYCSICKHEWNKHKLSINPYKDFIICSDCWLGANPCIKEWSKIVLD